MARRLRVPRQLPRRLREDVQAVRHQLVRPHRRPTTPCTRLRGRRRGARGARLRPGSVGRPLHRQRPRPTSTLLHHAYGTPRVQHRDEHLPDRRRADLDDADPAPGAPTSSSSPTTRRWWRPSSARTCRSPWSSPSVRPGRSGDRPRIAGARVRGRQLRRVLRRPPDRRRRRPARPAQPASGVPGERRPHLARPRPRVEGR